MQSISINRISSCYLEYGREPLIIDFPFRKERRNYVGKDQLQRMCRNEIERRVKEEADLVERKYPIFTGFFNLESKEHHFYRGKGRKKDEI